MLQTGHLFMMCLVAYILQHVTIYFYGLKQVRLMTVRSTLQNKAFLTNVAISGKTRIATIQTSIITQYGVELLKIDKTSTLSTSSSIPTFTVQTNTNNAYLLSHMYLSNIYFNETEPDLRSKFFSHAARYPTKQDLPENQF